MKYLKPWKKTVANLHPLLYPAKLAFKVEGKGTGRMAKVVEHLFSKNKALILSSCTAKKTQWFKELKTQWFKELKTSNDKYKLKEFMTIKPALQKILKEILYS
jgi:hypothetical protein